MTQVQNTKRSSFCILIVYFFIYFELVILNLEFTFLNMVY